ncbi:MAG: thiamine phosphate synthase [Candidatus Korobacteraceae bacterium]|jgi:thiamine-phosphate pyrophosphorylase
MLLYYITDRQGFAGTDTGQRTALLRRIAEAARAGVDYIQLREKDLSPRELERLAREAVRAVRDSSNTTKLLINGRADVALACAADGVHLPSGELPASEIRALWITSCHREPVIGVSAHSLADVRGAEAQGANFAVLAPIFEKVQTAVKGIGLDALREACLAPSDRGDAEAPASARFAVLALGGVSLTNARACLQAGAAGLAGIRLFQNGDLLETVRQLRVLHKSHQ